MSDEVLVNSTFTVTLEVDDAAFSNGWRYLQPEVQCAWSNDRVTPL